ncbi:MAG TPA: GxxExxY protein [Caulobacteraceae bacterium]
MDPYLRELTGEIVDAGLKVHRTLGPGLLESAYEHCLAFELSRRGLDVERQVTMPVFYEGVRMDAAYRLDLLVRKEVILEVKAVETLTRVHEAQLLTYLKLSGLPVGYLMNFNAELFKNGVRRLRL